MSRIGIVLRTGAWSAGIQGITVTAQLVTVPLFLRAWSPELYGDWLTLWSLTAYIGLADVGVQGFALNRLTQHAVMGRGDELRRELASVLGLEAVLLGAAVPLYLGALDLLPLDHWLTGSLGPAVQMTAVLLTLRVAVDLVLGLAGGLYRVLGRADLMQAVSCVTQGCLLGGTLLVLASGRGPLALATILLATDLTLLVLIALDVRRRDPRLTFTLRGASPRLARALLGPSLLFFLLTIANGLTVQGLVITTSMHLGAAAVVTFTTTRVLVNVVRQVVVLCVNAVWNEFTRLDAEGARRHLVVVHSILVKLAAVVAAAASALLWNLGPELYAWWTGGRVAPDVTLLHWLLLDQVVAAPVFVSAMLLAATNAHRTVALVQASAGVAIVLLATLLAKPLGVPAMAVSLTLVDLVWVATTVPRLVQAKLGEPISAYYGQLVLPAYAAAVIVTGLGSMVRVLVVPGLIEVAVIGVVVTVSAASLFWLALLSQSERAIVATRLAGLTESMGRGRRIVVGRGAAQ